LLSNWVQLVPLLLGGDVAAAGFGAAPHVADALRVRRRVPLRAARVHEPADEQSRAGVPAVPARLPRLAGGRLRQDCAASPRGSGADAKGGEGRR
jgi:hypothetical protein